MSDSVTAWQPYRRAVRPALFGVLAFLLAGCAAADAPMPFITTPEPQTTATTTSEQPVARTHGADQAQAAAQAPAAAHAGASTAAGSGTANRSAPHSPAREDLPFPSFARPAATGDRPVLDDAAKTKMQSDLEALAKSRETKMRQDIEQAQ